MKNIKLFSLGEAYYQKHKENVDVETLKKKPQFFVEFDNINIINMEDIQFVKYSEDYILTFSKDIKEYLNNLVKNRTNVTDISVGLTKEHCLDMCKEHDKIAKAKENPKNKIQHPLSKDQIKQNEQNKLKQKEKNGITNDENPF